MKRARWFVLVWVVVPLLALLVGVAVLVALSAKTASGTAFLLASVTKWVPQLRIVQPEGPLFGVFKAQRIEWHDDAQHHVVLTNPNCSGVTLQRAAHTRSKMGVTMAQCRVDAVLVDWPSSAKSQVAPPLPTLQLPFALSVKALSIGAVQSPQLGSDHLQQVIGAVDLQSLGQQGVQHHIHLKQLQWQVWRMSGKLQVVPGNNIELHASLQASSDTGDADVQLDGPLRQLQAKGQVRIRGQSAVDDASPEVIEQRQALNVRAVMTPLNVWPVESAQVEANRLDLKRLNRQWPTSLLTGQVSVLPKQLSQQGLPARIEMSVQLNNEASGPWDAERIPVRKMQAALRLPVSGIQSADWLALWREGDVQAHLQLPTQGPSPGSIELSGHWHMDQRQHTALQARLTDVDTRALHTRAPALRLNGPVSVQGTPEQAWRLTGELTGQDRGQGLLPQAVKAQWQARWQPDKWWVDALKLQSAGAQAELKGQWQRQLDGRWQAQGDISLADVDPAVWMPWPRPSGDKAQATRLNGKSHWQIKGQGDQLTRLEGLQGSSEGQLQNSLLLGVATAGQWHLTATGQHLTLQAKLKASVNQADISATLPLPKNGPWTNLGGLAGVQVQGKVQAPVLSVLQPWAAPFGVHDLGGQLMGQVQLSVPAAGRWQTTGQAQADKLTARWQGEQASLQGVRAQWSLASGPKANATPWQVNASVEQAQWADWKVQQLLAELQGTAEQHTWRTVARVDLPPRPLPSGRVFKESVRAQWVGEGHWRTPATGRTQWTAQVQTLRVAPLTLDVIPTWLDAQPFEARLDMTPQAMQWHISPTRVTVLGLVFDLQQAQGQIGGQDHLNVQATLAPVRVAELLSRWQPRAGWGGDLTLDGTLQMSHRQGQPWEISANLSRRAGDLTLTDTHIEGAGVQALGLRQIALNLSAKNGVWTASQSLDGLLLGKVEARQVIKPKNPQAWPTAADALQGELTAAISDARALGAWAPAGWRLAGQVEAQASLSGTLGQPQYRGAVIGRQLGAQNALLGIDLTDGDLRMSLQGSQAQLEQLTLKGAGAQGGLLQVSGQASLSGQPQATLQIQAQRFSLLNRGDRKAHLSGQAQVQLKGSDSVKVDGALTFDDGFFDVSRVDAPTVGDDVNVINRPDQLDLPAGTDGVAADASSATKRQWQVNMALGLGDRLFLKGRGLDTRLSGDLKLTTPNGRSQVHGTVATVNGTYVSYGQKLLIERGSLTFSGPVDNPRLDIKAMRAQSPTAESSDVKVGVLINGTAVDPRVRLYSEPPMSETEKLSWLVLGRGPTGLGVADIGLLQTAASALWSGESASPDDTLVGMLGLDELSVRQTDGAVRDTIVTLGKQISRRWYLGYERSLSTTTGTWQAVYRAAQRFTVRFQTGDDNAIDLIWLWRGE